MPHPLGGELHFAFLRHARERLRDGIRKLRRGGAKLRMRLGKAAGRSEALDAEYVEAYAR
jgi:hypothetical protein